MDNLAQNMVSISHWIRGFVHNGKKDDRIYVVFGCGSKTLLLSYFTWKGFQAKVTEGKHVSLL